MLQLTQVLDIEGVEELHSRMFGVPHYVDNLTFTGVFCYVVIPERFTVVRDNIDIVNG